MATLEEDEIPNPAAELDGDIEAAIEQQEKGGELEETVKSTAEPKETEGSPDRDEKGRFKPKGDSPATAVAQDTPQDEPVTDQAPQPQRPPPGFSVASKAEWDNLPQAVRDDIAKREQEVGDGLKRYSGLRQYAEQAERNGTTLQNAVTDYVSVENELNKNFFGGVEYLCQRYGGKLGIHPVELLRALGQRYGGQGEAQPAQQAPAQQIDPQAIAAYAANMVRSEFQQREIDSSIVAFEADPKNKFFPNVRQDMARIVQSGKASNLQEAYEAACWWNPEIRQTLINEANGGANRQAAATASKARAAAKAIGGSPSDGVNPDRVGKRQKQSIDADIDAAIAAQVDVA